MSNTTSRLTDSRSKNRAVKAVEIIVARRGQRGAARMLRVNSGMINHILSNTPKSWTHVTLTPALLDNIELAAEWAQHDAALTDEIKAALDRLMQNEAEHREIVRDLIRKIRKL